MLTHVYSTHTRDTTDPPQCSDTTLRLYCTSVQEVCEVMILSHN